MSKPRIADLEKRCSLETQLLLRVARAAKELPELYPRTLFPARLMDALDAFDWSE